MLRIKKEKKKERRKTETQERNEMKKRKYSAKQWGMAKKQSNYVVSAEVNGPPRKLGLDIETDDIIHTPRRYENIYYLHN